MPTEASKSEDKIAGDGILKGWGVAAMKVVGKGYLGKIVILTQLYKTQSRKITIFPKWPFLIQVVSQLVTTVIEL